MRFAFFSNILATTSLWKKCSKVKKVGVEQKAYAVVNDHRDMFESVFVISMRYKQENMCWEIKTKTTKMNWMEQTHIKFLDVIKELYSNKHQGQERWRVVCRYVRLKPSSIPAVVIEITATTEFEWLHLVFAAIGNLLQQRYFELVGMICSPPSTICHVVCLHGYKTFSFENLVLLDSIGPVPNLLPNFHILLWR